MVEHDHGGKAYVFIPLGEGVPMQTFILRRLITLVPVLLVVTMIAFSIILLLPGDPALAMLGEEKSQDKQLYQQLRAELGLDQPIPIQYLVWLRNLMEGNMGISVRTQKPVSELIMQGLEATAELSLLAMIVAVVVGIPLGIVSAIRPNSLPDSIGTLFALSGVAIPHFLLGVLLLYLFTIWVHVLPAGGYVPLEKDIGQSLLLMLMPSITLGIGIAAMLMRQVRSAMIEVLQQEYVIVARSKGLRERVVLWRHALKNAMVPILTIIGVQTGRLFGGAVVVETIFSIPGIGRLAVSSIFNRDFPAVQGVVLVMAVAVLLSNFLTDMIYAYVDPRIRYG